MMLEKELCRIMDFPNDIGKAYHEAVANNKLRGTFMIVNNVLAYIKDFDVGGNTVSCSVKPDGPTMDLVVNSLELYLPETGVYAIGKQPTMLWRVPHKQWRKSFSWDFYSATGISNSTCSDVYKFFGLQAQKIIEHNNKIYFYTKEIGNVIRAQPGGVLDINCTNPVFYQELSDYIRDKELQWNL
jgi:hypothetical protein